MQWHIHAMAYTCNYMFMQSHIHAITCARDQALLLILRTFVTLVPLRSAVRVMGAFIIHSTL